jgi:hypothetical protein
MANARDLLLAVVHSWQFLSFLYLKLHISLEVSYAGPPCVVLAWEKGKWKSHEGVREHEKIHQGMLAWMSKSSQVRTVTSERALAFLRDNR